jgi:hypothetical protein
MLAFGMAILEVVYTKALGMNYYPFSVKGSPGQCYALRLSHRIVP